MEEGLTTFSSKFYRLWKYDLLHPRRNLVLLGRLFRMGNLRVAPQIRRSMYEALRLPGARAYSEPRQYYMGIEYVLVNGELAMDKGILMKTLSGKFLIHETK